MIRIDIRPVWSIRAATEREFDFQLVALLGEIEANGKITSAAEAAGFSYRHAWNLIARWEAFFGAALVAKAQGRGSSLTALGKRLLWAARRAQSRLEPELENLAGEFARQLNAALTDCGPALAVQASHDYAVGLLRDHCAAAGADIDLQYKGSFEALAALRRGECDVAGFHLPEGRLGALMEQRYAECLAPGDYRFVSFATRTQGFIVRPGNPLAIAALADLARPGVRMVNRQRGSGTRALLEFLIAAEGLDRARLAGYDQEETTHGAVAALVAGHQADVGFGVQAAAAEYGLGFVPACRERYWFACRAAQLASPAFAALLAALREPAFAAAVARLPGYAPLEPGKILEAFEAAAATPR